VRERGGAARPAARCGERRGSGGGRGSAAPAAVAAVAARGPAARGRGGGGAGARPAAVSRAVPARRGGAAQREQGLGLHDGADGGLGGARAQLDALSREREGPWAEDDAREEDWRGQAEVMWMLASVGERLRRGVGMGRGYYWLHRYAWSLPLCVVHLISV